VFQRDVTQQEQHIIDARVAAQRQMFDEYEKREKSRKVCVWGAHNQDHTKGFHYSQHAHSPFGTTQPRHGG
jgi:hypothetical protein